MTIDQPDPLLDSARRERAVRWLSTEHGHPTLSAEEETEATLAAEPKTEQVKKGKPRQDGE
jgi:hypothetical protein